MAGGFFDLSAYNIERGDERRKTPTIHDCRACGLSKLCLTPKVRACGEGNKKILIIGDQVSKLEDDSKNTRHGTYYRYLKKAFNKVGIDIEEDCWYTHAIKCHSKKEYGAITQSACHAMLIKEIEELKPSYIVTTCQEAFTTLLYDRMEGRAAGVSYMDWCGELIPDKVLQTWILPLYPTKTVMDEDEGQYNKYALYYEQHIRLLTKQRRFPQYDAEELSRICLTDEETFRALDKINSWPTFAFDYETTGIKPHRKGQNIVAISASNGQESFAFKATDAVKKRWATIMQNDAIKVAHNQSFERSWTKNILGVEPNNLCHDTMIMQHCLNNTKPTGLKFLTYARFGFLGYDSECDEFLKSTNEESKQFGTNGINQIHKAPLRKLLKYNAMDSLFTFWLYEDLLDELDVDHQLPGYKFFMEAIEGLDYAHENGMNIDVDFMQETRKRLEKETGVYEKAIMDDNLIRHTWDRKQFNPKSDADLRHLLFDILKYEITSYTDTGLPAVDVDALLAYKDRCPLANNLLLYRKWSKALNTYIGQTSQETVDGKVHPFLVLHKTKTHRSCVAKGTPILVARDFVKYPKGVPIEEIREGDFVYSFNDSLQLVLKKVVWSGKTGHRKVIRLHYRGGCKKKMHLDVTPEHLIRTISGEYIEAQNLFGYETRDLSVNKNKYRPRTQVLSCARGDERLYATHHQPHLEHRFVYEFFSGEKLNSEDIIHHIDGNHFNHEFSNLMKTDNRTHSGIHVCGNLLTPASRKKNIEVVKRLHKEGRYKYHCGEDNYLFLGLTRTQCLRQFVEARGKLREAKHDFNTYLSHCKRLGLDVHAIKIRYNSKGEYLSRWKVIKALDTMSIRKVCIFLGMGYYKVKMLCEHYGINTNDFFGISKYNLPPWRKAVINNHAIIGIEYLEQEVDVYDIEVEDTHNFIANEICVHNSSNSPNFQNQPKRDKEVMKVLRSMYKPSTGHRIIEYDFKGAEVSCSAAVSGDKNLIKYVSNLDLDMHRDLATGLFFLDISEVSKGIRGELTKGPWTFAQFYGSWYKQCAENIWQMLHVPNAEKRYGLDILARLAENGITDKDEWEEHCREQEKVLWGDQFFSGYQKFRDDTFDFFKKKGYIDYVNGFRYYGPATRNECLNAPVQGPAFHIQLWAFTQIAKELRTKKMESKLIGQIHDSIVADVAPEEEIYFDYMVYQYATQKVREHYTWITVPLVIEKERSEVNGNWANMTAMGYLQGGSSA